MPHAAAFTDAIAAAAFADTIAAAAIRSTTGSGYDGKPTTGFHAIITMAFACRSVDLYGFSGSSTINGHVISGDHGIEREHAVLRQLVDKTLPVYNDARMQREWSHTSVRHVG